MTDSDLSKPRLRADGARNRSKLIDVARATFAERGAAASLDQVARQAGVGIGTLYRHFPTRQALVEAVYRQETDELVAAAARLAQDMAPLAALRAWLLLFVAYLATKQVLSSALDVVIGQAEPLGGDASARVSTVVEALAAAAVADGAIQMTIEPTDLLRAVAGVMTLRPGPSWAQSAERMVDVLLDGLGRQR